MAKKGNSGKGKKTGFAQDCDAMETALATRAQRPSSLIDTRVIYCGDCLEQLRKLPDKCIDLIYIDPWGEEIEQSFNSNRNYDVFWGKTKGRH